MSDQEYLLSGQVQGGLLTKPVEKPSVTAPLIFSIMAGFGALFFGFTLGFTSPIGDTMKDDLKWTSDQQSLFGSLANVGAMVGALSGGYFLDAVGRRRSILLGCVPSVGGFILVYFCKTFGAAIAGRLLTGFGVGLFSLAVPVYIAEIAPSHLRGGMGSINQLGVTTGILVAYAIGLGVSWRPLALIGACIPAILAVFTFFFPPSPRWLFGRGRQQDAAVALQKLRGPLFNIDEEMNDIENTVRQAQAAKNTSPLDVFRGGAGKAMFISGVLMLFQQCSGINVVIFYSGKIFEDAGMSNPNVPALIVSAVQVVITGLSGTIIDRAGRRALIMAAGIGMAASSAVLGYYFYEQDQHQNPNGIIAVISLVLYIFCFSLGLGAVPWLMMSEIFPSNVRGMASSISTLLNWTFSFGITESFQSLIDALTEQGVFWAYGGICLLGTIFVLLKVPETKGRSLEEIERFFAGDKTAGNQHIDGAGTGGFLVKIASCCALLYVGIILLASNA
ncbi:uncharacterized protein MONBRDRAFT_10586 [Monosiga brevicollis MX1]|uniref:Major facilitator superfamily (MFS) profile domain-containing protein n=1 Tax=Monosiga brevicollis TaxID=81824 RepID=A9V6T6_MONBE|nr:uncharacterized protein MONBRDRAFT_10586 [Monosiga brevicollis MX1]EDQ86863.1 predicted protein [Monosiga brevicollis MX1]|eukprot:XP_001748408.1 hypothetical protein [Monosiga brevicollis MX1]